MIKEVDVLIYNDRKGITIGVKDIYNDTVVPVKLRDLIATSFASAIACEICKIYNITDNDDKIYHNMYDFGRHILAMPDEYRSMITITLKINVAEVEGEEDFGYRLKNRREALGMKREFVASKMDVSTSTITKWESGERNVPMNRLVELCNILEVSPNELLGWER